MADQKIMIMTGVLVLGAAVTLLVDRSGKKSDPRLGQTLFVMSKANGIDAIDVQRGDTKVALRRDGTGAWHQGDSNGFPVDAGKVASLYDDLSRATVESVAGSGANATVSGEFGLATPTSVTAKAKDQEILALKMGDDRKGGGQYLAFAGDTKVYLIHQGISTPADADAWEMKQLVNIEKDLVKEVSFTPTVAPGGKPADQAAVTLVRAKKEDPLGVKDLDKAQKERAEVHGADMVLKELSFTKRYDPGNAEAKAALANTSKVVVTLFDGRTYEVHVGSVGDKTKKYFLTLHIEKNNAPLDDKAQKALAMVNDLMSKYAFEVPAFTAQKFEKKRSDMVEAQTKG